MKKAIYYIYYLAIFIPFRFFKNIHKDFISFFRKPTNVFKLVVFLTFLVFVFVFYLSLKGKVVPLFIPIFYLFSLIVFYFWKYAVSGEVEDKYKKYLNKKVDQIHKEKFK